MKIINYGFQTINENDIKSVSKILRSKLLTQGSQVDLFESKIKQLFGGRFCTVVSSGTAALHLSILALNLKKNDIIITTPITFLATATSIINAGCKVF